MNIPQIFLLTEEAILYVVCFIN